MSGVVEYLNPGLAYDPMDDARATERIIQALQSMRLLPHPLARIPRPAHESIPSSSVVPNHGAGKKRDRRGKKLLGFLMVLAFLGATMHAQVQKPVLLIADHILDVERNFTGTSSHP